MPACALCEVCRFHPHTLSPELAASVLLVRRALILPLSSWLLGSRPGTA